MNINIVLNISAFSFIDLHNSECAAKEIAHQIFREDPSEHYFSDGLRIIIQDSNGGVKAFDISFEYDINISAEEVEEEDRE